jgi:methyl-accepting chemotaxis protein
VNEPAGKGLRIGIALRLRLSFGAVLALVLAVGFFSFSALNGLSGTLKASLSSAMDGAQVADDLRLIARQTYLVLTGAAAAGATLDLANVTRLQHEFDGVLTDARRRGLRVVELDTASAGLASMIDTGGAFVRANAQQEWTKAGDLSVRFEKDSKAFMDKLEQARQRGKAAMETEVGKLAADLRSRALQGAAGLFGCALLAFMLSLAIERRVIGPLASLRAVSARIVEHGDLSQRIEIKSRDEIGDLALSFSKLVEKLRRIPLSLGEATDVLTRSVANLQVTAQEQSSTITRQSAALQETAVTAQQIRQTSAAAAQRAAAVMEVVSRADEVSRLGEESIESSLGGLSEIGSTVQSITGQIALLSERTLQIGGITATVKDLADHSNMLALNAAIEAVRSGEHGKGFAVVAREIRSLADQSIRATARVREILDDVSRTIAQTANMVAQGQRRMESGIAQVRASGETLRNLSQMVKDSSGAVRDIASSVAQQNNGIGQIFSAIRDLNSIMEDATRRLDSNDRAVSDLKDVSDRVSGIVDTYRA